MVELRAPEFPYDFNNIAWQPGESKSKVFKGFRAGLANPEQTRTPSGPVMPAHLSRTGHTVSYACPWCSHRHRHHADAGILAGRVTSKAQHCREWRRAHPGEWRDSIFLRLAGRG